MALTKHYTTLIEFLRNHEYLNDDDNSLIIDASKEEILQLLNSLDIKGEFDELFSIYKSRANCFRLVSDNKLSDFYIYSSVDLFLINISPYKRTNNYIILTTNNVFYSFYNSKSFIDDKEAEDLYFFKNMFAYIDFIDKLTEIGQECNKSDKGFKFIDYYNPQNQTFFLSSINRSALIKRHTKFNLIENDISSNFQIFEESLATNSKNQLPFFIKREIIDEWDRNSSDDSLINIFFNFKKIYDKAHINFQIYINDISIDKLKGEYDDFKKEYLSSFSEIISKILLKIISIPITFAATIYALTKVDSVYLTVLLILGIVASSVIINISLYNHFLDLKTIGNLLIDKTRKIAEHTFFINNHSEKGHMKKIIDHIKLKVGLVVKYIWAFFIFSSFFIICVCIYPSIDIFNGLSLDKKFSVAHFTTQNWICLPIVFVYFIHVLFIAFFKLIPYTIEINKIKKSIHLNNN